VSQTLQLHSKQGIAIMDALSQSVEQLSKDAELNFTFQLSLPAPKLGVDKETVLALVKMLEQCFECAPTTEDFLLLLEVQGSKAVKQALDSKVEELKKAYEETQKQTT
jgi:P2-related tail formation protein